MATLRLITPTPGDERGPLPPHANPSHSRVLRLLERSLLIVGLVCLAYYGYVSAEAAVYQAYDTLELDAILTSMPAPTEPTLETPIAAEPPRTRPRPGSMIGRLEIPRLRVSAIVRA